MTDSIIFWHSIIGGRSISNLRYADDTALCGKSPQEINNIAHKVNDAGRKRLLKMNARKTKLMVVGDENTNVSFDVDGETIDKVNSFKYLGAIKTSTGSCSEDVKARIGRAKKATMELDTILNDSAHMASHYSRSRMNFKLDANSLPKLSKEKWLSLDMHAETISVIL